VWGRRTGRWVAVVMTAVIVASGVWLVGLRDDASEAVDADVVLAEAGGIVKATESLASQALVYALDEDRGIIDEASLDGAVAALTEGIEQVAAYANRVESGPVMIALDDFGAQAASIVVAIEEEDIAEARRTFGEDLAQAKDGFLRASIARRAQLAAIVATTEQRSRLAGGLALGMALALLAASVVELRGKPRRRVESAGLVIQLPDDGEGLPPRRRYPKVSDLAWLLDQVVEPFAARGWDLDFECPEIGVDCDPADVREIVSSILYRAETAGAERIGLVVRPERDRVLVTIADDGESVFADGGRAADPVLLKSAVRSRAERATATLAWARRGDLNLATLDLPRLMTKVEEPVG